MKKFIATLLTIGVGLFLADAVVSLLDDSLIVFFGIQALTAIRGIVFFFAFITVAFIYLLMGITPLIPKRYFLPLTLFSPVVFLGMIPLSIYHFDRFQQIAWVISLCQVIFGLSLLVWLQGGFSLRWPLVREERLGNKMFGWRNLFGFILVNVFVLLPGVLVYLAWCGSLAVDHFSGGFLALRSDSLVVRARQYVRNDGKTIHLIPMMHIGESGFYQQITKSIPTNSAILLEGVSDEGDLLKRKLSYQRVATSLGLSEQHEEFAPAQGRPRPADVDIGQFSKKTIEFLKLATLIHSQGMTADVFPKLIQQSQDPLLAKELWEDLLTRRNEHLLKEIQTELLQSDTIVVPWGAAHMRGIAEEIQKTGFQPTSEQEYTVLYYQTIWNRLRSRGQSPTPGKTGVLN